MRSYYLNNRHESSGSRGGVGSGRWDGDYELEIGANQNCSSEMLAFCVHIDEILEHLENNGSAIGAMLLGSIKRKREEIDKHLIDSRIDSRIDA